MPDSMLFREAVPTDHPAMAEIYRLCLESADWMPLSARQVADFDRDSEGERKFVVEKDGAILGFASIWEPDSFVHLLFIHPQAQGRGVGSLILASLPEYIPLPWQLKCTCANQRAYLFYLSRGWIALSIGDSNGEPYWLMERASLNNPALA